LREPFFRVVRFAPFLAPFFDPFFAAIRSSSQCVALFELARTIQMRINSVKHLARADRAG
jgi:hypothetical protein